MFHSFNLRLGGYTYCWSSLPLYKDHHCLLPRSDFTQNSRKPKNESDCPAPPGGLTSPARRFINKPNNWLRRLASPGGRECAARRFLFQEPRIHQFAWVAWRWFITRQAVSGKFQKNRIYEGFNSTQTINIPYSYTLIIICIKLLSPAPLTWNFLCLIWVVWDIPMISMSSPFWCGHSNLTRTSLKPHQTIGLYDLFSSHPRLPLNYLGFFPTFHIQFKAKMPKT